MIQKALHAQGAKVSFIRRRVAERKISIQRGRDVPQKRRVLLAEPDDAQMMKRTIKPTEKGRNRNPKPQR